MIDPKALEYVRQQLQAGASKGNIVASLASSGWSQQDIDSAFAQIGATAPAAGVPVPPAKGSRLLSWVIVVLIGIAIIGVPLYRAYRDYEARKQITQQSSIVEQQLQQDQNAMNGDTSILGSTTPPTTSIPQVSSGATVTTTGTQNVPQDAQGPYGDPRGTVTVSGTANVGNVEVILKPVSYTAGFVTGAPTMYTDTSTDYATNSNTWSPKALSVSGGKWSTSFASEAAGDYTVLVYSSSSDQLIATGKLTVKLSSTWGAPSATIDQSSLTATSRNPIITGTATNIADLNVQVGEDYYDPHVENGHWATYSPATLTAGTYKVIVRTLDVKEKQKVLATGTLVVQ
jgi:hypothetical protein